MEISRECWSWKFRESASLGNFESAGPGNFERVLVLEISRVLVSEIQDLTSKFAMPSTRSSTRANKRKRSSSPVPDGKRGKSAPAPAPTPVVESVDTEDCPPSPGYSLTFTPEHEAEYVAEYVDEDNHEDSEPAVINSPFTSRRVQNEWLAHEFYYLTHNINETEALIAHHQAYADRKRDLLQNLNQRMSDLQDERDNLCDCCRNSLV